MQPLRNTLVYTLCALLWLQFYPVFSGIAAAQEAPTTPVAVRVGVIEAPPSAIKTADNRWEGLSIELWQALAQDANIRSTLKEFSSLELVMAALENKEIDVIPALPAREELLATMDFSQPYLKTGLAIAVPAEGFETSWLRVVERMFAWDVVQAITLLVVLAMLAGTTVWFFERRHNHAMFGRGLHEGMGHGVWWAMVTMTTVGYGDKAPQSLGGRSIAVVWMLFSLVFVASFTANITATLTINQLKGKVHGLNDLHRVKVGAVPHTEAFVFLAKQGIPVIPVTNFQQGLQAVARKNIDALVANELIVKHLVRAEFPGQIEILPGTFDAYFVNIALQKQSPLREDIDRALLKLMKTGQWTELQNRYVP